MNDFNSLPPRYALVAALGYARREERDPESLRGRKVSAFLRRMGTDIAQYATEHPELLRYMCEERLIAPEDAEAWLSAADRFGGGVEARALILEAVNARREAEDGSGGTDGL